MRERGWLARASARTPTRPTFVDLCRSGQDLCGEFPIHEVVEKRLDEVGAAVLVIEIIGVLPDVAGEERGLTERERRHGVRRLRDLELVLVDHQPSPAAAELADRGLLELIFEFGEAAEIAVDARGERARRFSAAIGLHRGPEEGVVPRLR